MSKVRKIPHPNNGGPNPTGNNSRVESGAVQFGEDWPGLFLRGDDAFGFVRNFESIENFLLTIPDELKVKLGGLELAIAFGQMKNICELIKNDVVCKQETSDENSH